MEPMQVQGSIDETQAWDWDEPQRLTDQLLRKAVWDRDTTAISSLLQQGADANFTSEDGTILLCIITRDGGWLDAVSLLINHGANVNAVDPGGESALMYAAREGLPELLQLLYTAGADIQLTDEDGENALMKAAASLHPRNVQHLINWGCKVNAQDNTGQTALHHSLLDEASSCGDGLTCVSLLLQLGADPNIQDATGLNALHSAIQSNWPLDTLTLLADKVTDINATDSNGSTALLHAVEGLDDADDVVHMLIDHRADVRARDSQGNTALHYVRTESQSLRKLLIDAGGDVMTTNNANHTPAVCDLLMDFEEDDIFLDCNLVNGNGQSLLEILGPRSGQSASRGALSQRELDANRQMHLPVRDSNGQTTLHLAALHGCSSELTVAGDFNAKDSCGFTPLHCLMTIGPHEFYESNFNLLVSKCNVDAVNLDGQTALHMAASHDFSNALAVKGLIKAGASVNAVDKEGNSALMLAVASNYFELVRILLGNGTLVNATNCHGQTALWLAAAHRWDEVVEALLLHGALVNIADIDGVSPLLASIESTGPSFARSLPQPVRVNAAQQQTVEQINVVSGGPSMDMEQGSQGAGQQSTPTSMLSAVRTEAGGLVQTLLRCGAQPNEPDNEGMTPLVAACQSGHLQYVRDLLAARADPSLAEAQGQTPLIAAAEEGFFEIVAALLTAGAEVDATDSEWQTPLMAAAAEGNLKVVQALLEAGADASHCNEEGTTVLMGALGYIDVMEALVAAGADVNAYDGDDETILIMAAREADLECVQWLLENGADHEHTTREGETALQAAYAAYHEQLDDAAEIVDLLRDANLSSMESDDDSESDMCSESDLFEDSSPKSEMNESAVEPGSLLDADAASPSAPPLESLL